MRHTLKIAVVLGLFLLLSLLATACGGAAATGPNPVHMDDQNFKQSSITIKKGQVVTLINDAIVNHVIENGTWDANGNQRPGTEVGAPKVDYNVTANGSQTIGPFNTAGTFKLYCTVHTGMNLTVIVQ